MKRFFRKPLILVYVLAVAVGWFALLYMDRDIRATQKEFDDVSLRTIISGEVYTTLSTESGYRIPYAQTVLLENNPALHHIYTEMVADSGRMQAGENPDLRKDPLFSVYGTNQLERYLREHQLKLLAKQEPESGAEAIYLDSQLAESCQVQLGDRFRLYLTSQDIKTGYAKPLSLQIVGIFDSSASDIAPRSALILESTFFGNLDFLQWGTLEEKYGFYKKFQFEVRSEYNHQYDQIEEQIYRNLPMDTGCYLHTNAREFFNVIQPLKDKIQMQTQIYWAIVILLLCITSFLCVLFVKREKMEILIRLVFGEAKGKIYGTELFQFGVLLLLSLGILWAIFEGIMGCPLWMLGMFLAVNLVTVASNLAWIVYKGILTLYQNWEG